MKPEKQISIQNLENARANWDDIREKATFDSTVSPVHQLKGILATRMQDNQDMASHLDDIDNKNMELAEHKMHVPELIISIIVLEGLPEKYNFLKTLLYDKPSVQLNVSKIRARLLEFASTDNSSSTDEVLFTKARVGNSSRFPNSQSTANKDSNKGMVCHYCNKSGHFQRQCFYFKTHQLEKQHPDIPVPDFCMIARLNLKTTEDAKLTQSD